MFLKFQRIQIWILDSYFHNNHGRISKTSAFKVIIKDHQIKGLQQETNRKKLIQETRLYTTIYIKYIRKFIHPTECCTDGIISYCEEQIEKLNIINDGLVTLRGKRLRNSRGGATIGDVFSLLFLINSLYTDSKN